MKRYNAKFIFEVGQSVAHLRDCIEGRVQAWSKDRMMPFIFVTFDGAVRAVGLSVSCSRHAERVCAVLNEIGETDGEISDKQWTRLKKSIEEFDTVFRSACEDMDLFLVEDLRGYSSVDLVERGECLLGQELNELLEERARDDLRDATRALAFDIPTASVFHITRVTEDVMRQYNRAVLCKTGNNQQLTMGSLLKSWKELEGDPKPSAATIATLEHIKASYRDRVGHPDARFSTDEAHDVLPLCISVIRQLLGGIQEKQAAEEK